MSETKQNLNIEPKETPPSILELPDIKIDQILLQSTRLFLNSVINEKMTWHISRGLIGLNTLNLAEANISGNNKCMPIVIYICSPGGSVTHGFNIIDTINEINTPVITIVKGMAASMAAVIAIAGKIRVMSKNSFLMFHPMTSGYGYDYIQFQQDDFNYIKRLNRRLVSFIKNHSKLNKKGNKKYLDKIQNGALYLSPKEAKKLGFIDRII